MASLYLSTPPTLPVHSYYSTVVSLSLPLSKIQHPHGSYIGVVMVVVVLAITLRKQVEVCGGRVAYKCLSAPLLIQS